MSRSRILAVLTVTLLFAAPLVAETFEVRLANGHVFITRYEPEPAPWDDSLLYFMTVTSNTMAIPQADVKEVISSIEAAGRGTYLDANTILIGAAPNDNLTPEELEALGDEAPPPQQPYNVLQFAEPNQTQGIPVWFTNQTTPPVGGGGGAFGSAASERRGGGGVFSEPNSSNF